jgi:ABC-type transporter Mla MlaB component
VVEAAHDPDLDEAVMAYANGDSEQAEQLLMGLIRQGGGRDHHAETWMVVFDLYRATGQQAQFEAIALEYAQRFGHSAPHWFSLPRMIAEAVTPTRQRPARIDGKLSWTAPPRLDAASLSALRGKTQALPLPWVFDWSALREIDHEACAALLAMAQHWATQPLDMRWIGGEQLLSVLAQATPVGVRDTDAVFWQLRLQLLRLVNRPDQFDEVAIDYCVTFEVSPPSWEATACQVRVSGSAGAATNIAPTTIIGEANTSFVESQLTEEPGLVELVQLELSGQLLGDISEVLRRLDEQIGEATLVEVSCARLLRVDFMAAGDLLNWVLACGRAGRHVSFTDTVRVVALFFSAIGIDEHAGVKVRAV